MNAKSILFAGCVAAITLSASVAMAGAHGFGAGGFSGGGSRGGGFHGGGGFRGGMGPGFARGGSRFGSGMSRNFRGGHDFRHRGFHDRFVFFGDPFFYDPFFYGYYPYAYRYYPYGYDPYGYGYGYDPYDQPGYRGTADGYGRASSVRDIQRRLARAGYYRGPIDGVMGPRTRYAMRAYQRSRDLRTTER
jgi:hypothetical protein